MRLITLRLVRGVAPLLAGVCIAAVADSSWFGGSCCPALPGYDLATGLGSP